jgi:hypothetical protein
MRVRELVPQPLQPLARRLYLQTGGATSGLRREPDFLVVGGQRCGTTSIFKTLSAHPQVLRPPVEKGTDYFTLHYERGPAWYRSHFPTAALARLRTANAGGPAVFEACTYYLFHPCALERIARDLPKVKLVIMLRDPVERAFSAFKHELARGFETVDDFEQALELEDQRLEGEIERMVADPGYASFSHRHHAYLRRGQYAEQLERAFALVPRGRIHITDSEAYFADPGREYRRLTDFLGLAPWQPREFGQFNARPSSPMPSAVRERLQAHFAPHDAKLSELLGRTPGWER